MTVLGRRLFRRETGGGFGPLCGMLQPWTASGRILQSAFKRNLSMTSKWGWATLFVAVAGLTMFADLASAQQQGQGRGRGMFGRGGIVSLAGNEAVQKELGIEADAKEKLASIGQAYGDEVREQMQTAGAAGLQNATDEERQKIMAKMQEITQKLSAKYAPKLKESLKPDQFTRLQQISWQASGAMAFSDPELAKALDLSKEQQEKINAVSQEFQQKLRSLFTGGGGGQEAFAKMREINQERDKKAEEILSKEQQDKLKELKGKPFDLAQLQPGGPGGRPGGERKGGDKGEKNK